MKTLSGPLGLGLAAFSMLLGACSVVSTPQPLGETPVKMAKSAWNGDWVIVKDKKNEGVFQIQVTNEELGQAALGSMEFKDNEYVVEQSSLALRSVVTKKSGTVQVFSVQDKEQGRWHPGVLTLKGDTLTARLLDPVKLRDLAKAGKLPALPEPPAPPAPPAGSALGPGSVQFTDPSVHADEAFTVALLKFIKENGPDPCLSPDRVDFITAKRLTDDG